MSNQDWQKLRDWLFIVFPADEAREMLEDHVIEAQEANIEVPDHIVAEVAR